MYQAAIVEDDAAILEYLKNTLIQEFDKRAQRLPSTRLLRAPVFWKCMRHIIIMMLFFWILKCLRLTASTYVKNPGIFI